MKESIMDKNTIDDFDEKKFEQEMERWSNEQYKGKLVNLYNEKPIQFDKKTVYKTMEKLNSGKDVSKKILVKMLNQLQYMIPEYQSLVFLMNCIAKDAKNHADRHAKIAYLELKK